MINEFIDAQSSILKLKDGLKKSLAECIPEYEQHFYFNHEIKDNLKWAGEDKMKWEIELNFYLPYINKVAPNKSLHRIIFLVECHYFLKEDKFIIPSIDIYQLERPVSPLYAFLLLNRNEMAKEVLDNCSHIFATPPESPDAISKDAQYLLNNNGSPFYNASSHKLKFTDYLTQINDKCIQNLFSNPSLFKLNNQVFKMTQEEVNQLKESFSTSFDKFICSIHAKKDLDINIDNFEEIIETITQYDIIYNHAQLENNLSSRSDNKIKKKI